MEKTSSATSDDKEKDKALPVFSCSLCELYAPYRYFGKKPTGVRKITFSEDVYIMDNPFTQGKEILVLGGHCSLCNAAVCVDEKCSLFNEKRFCTTCIERDAGFIPDELRNKAL